MFVDLCILITILGFVVELSTVRCHRLNYFLFVCMPVFTRRGTHMFCYLYVSRLWDRYLMILWNEDLNHVEPWESYIGSMIV